MRSEKILLTCATPLEAKAVRVAAETYGTVIPVEPQIDLLITGVGAVPTTYHLTQHIGSYGYILNFGIAGAFTPNLNSGDVTIVTSDCFADYGIDDNGKLLSFAACNLSNPDEPELSLLTNPHLKDLNLPFPGVKGITVSTASGSAKRISMLTEQFKPDIETMESAAIFYTCLMSRKKFICLRAISNRVEPRNRSNWTISEAISKLSPAIKQVIRIFPNS